MIFVGGIPRSGTTWLSAVVGRLVGGEIHNEPLSWLSVHEPGVDKNDPRLVFWRQTLEQAPTFSWCFDDEWRGQLRQFYRDSIPEGCVGFKDVFHFAEIVRAYLGDEENGIIASKIVYAKRRLADTVLSILRAPGADNMAYFRGLWEEQTPALFSALTDGVHLRDEELRDIVSMLVFHKLHDICNIVKLAWLKGMGAGVFVCDTAALKMTPYYQGRLLADFLGVEYDKTFFLELSNGKPKTEKNEISCEKIREVYAIADVIETNAVRYNIDIRVV